MNSSLIDWSSWVRKAQHGLENLSGETGGFAVVNTNDFTSGIEDIMITRSGGWVSVMPSMLGKGNALLAYARHAGLAPHHILAVGDHHNDLPMLGTGAAGHVGCPADAIPEVREAVQRAGGMVAGLPGPAGTVEVLRAHLPG